MTSPLGQTGEGFETEEAQRFSSPGANPTSKYASPDTINDLQSRGPAGQATSFGRMSEITSQHSGFEGGAEREHMGADPTSNGLFGGATSRLGGAIRSQYAARPMPGSAGFARPVFSGEHGTAGPDAGAGHLGEHAPNHATEGFAEEHETGGMEHPAFDSVSEVHAPDAEQGAVGHGGEEANFARPSFGAQPQSPGASNRQVSAARAQAQGQIHAQTDQSLRSGQYTQNNYGGSSHPFEQ